MNRNSLSSFPRTSTRSTVINWTKVARGDNTFAVRISFIQLFNSVIMFTVYYCLDGKYRGVESAIRTNFYSTAHFPTIFSVTYNCMPVYLAIPHNEMMFIYFISKASVPSASSGTRTYFVGSVSYTDSHYANSCIHIFAYTHKHYQCLCTWTKCKDKENFL